MSQQFRHLVCSLAIPTALACNSVLGLEHAEVAANKVDADPEGGSTAAGAPSTDPLLTAGGEPNSSASGGVGAAATQSFGGSSETSQSSGGTSQGAGGTSAGVGGEPAFGGAGGVSGQPGGAAGASPTGGSCGNSPNTTFSCLDAWLVSCAADNTTQSQDCGKPELCDSAHGECDICIANTPTCAGDHQVATCTSDGQGQTYRECPETAKFCSGGSCVACLVKTDCPAANDCFEPACSAEHQCVPTPSEKGTTCSLDGRVGVCDGAGACGSCVPEARRCSPTGVPELCVSTTGSGGQWEAQVPCSTTSSLVPYACVNGLCEPPPSCRGMSTGPTAQCGIDQNIHCCQSPPIPGATFSMGTNDTVIAEATEGPLHKAMVGSFRLDAFEVTVGRFRKFLADYQGPPAAWAGADPYQARELTGWRTEWNGQLPAAGPNAATSILKLMRTDLASATWTDSVGGHETFPINQVPWYVAFAFCTYDGGWLPSEAEWEYAASGPGVIKNYYPWGADSVDTQTPEYATYDASCPHTTCTPQDAFRPVGSAWKGVGAFGQFDLGGNVSEWTMDYYDPAYYQQFTLAVGGCNYCINTTPLAPAAPTRVTRGGYAMSPLNVLRVTARSYAAAATWSGQIGIRCARPL